MHARAERVHVEVVRPRGEKVGSSVQGHIWPCVPHTLETWPCSATHSLEQEMQQWHENPGVTH